MRRLLSWLVIGLGLALGSASAQTVYTPGIEAVACTQNAVLPSIASGQFGFANCDAFGRLYVSSIGWTPIGAYVTPISVTTASAASLLPSGPSVVIYNPGAQAAYIKFGQANTVVATTADDVVPAGGGCGFFIGANTYIAALTSTSTTTLNLSGGSGMAPGCWGGSGSGAGGSTNATIVGPLGTNTIANSAAVTPATSSVWPSSLTAQTPEAPAAATAITGLQLGGTYNGVPPAPALTTGQQGAVPIDQNGALNVGFDGATFAPASVTSATLIFAQDMTGYAQMTVQVTSAGTTCTITYETSEDNATWVTTAGYPSNFGTTSTAATTSTTAVLMTFPKRGRYFRARVSTFTSGTVTVLYSMHKTSFVGTGGTVTAGGVNASAAVMAGNPVPIATRAETADLVLANGNAAYLPSDLRGIPIFTLWALPSNTWQYTSPSGGAIQNTTAATVIQAAQAAGIRNYLKSLDISFTAGTFTPTEFVILDAAAVIYRSFIPAAVAAQPFDPRTIIFEPPLRGSTASSMSVQTLTATGTSTAVYVNAQGFLAP